MAGGNAEYKFERTGFLVHQIIGDVAEKWNLGRCLSWVIRRGRNSKSGLRGQDEEGGAPP